MTAGSFMVVTRRKTEWAVAGLFTVVVSQAIGYGLVLDWGFLFRNLSVCGGLLMLLSESWITTRKKSSFYDQLPALHLVHRDLGTWVSLAGRLLLLCLFASVVMAGEWHLARWATAGLGLLACGMVAIGFKARFSGLMLVALLSSFNLVLNNWWSLNHGHPEKDIKQFNFFSVWSVIGGLLMLVDLGPGGLSLDEKKKQF